MLEKIFKFIKKEDKKNKSSYIKQMKSIKKDSCNQENHFKIETKYDDNDYCFKIVNSLIIGKEDESKHLVEKLIIYNNPYHMKLVLIDYSKLNLTKFIGCKNLLYPVMCEVKKSVSILKKIYLEFENRASMFAKFGIEAFDKLNMDLPYIIIVIDEIYNLLIDTEGKEKLIKLMLHGEKVGIKVIAYSKFDLKNLDLGPLENLFTIRFEYSFKSLVPEKILSIENQLTKIDKELDGYGFENYSVELLKLNGFSKIELTQASRDFGVDIIAYKDDIKYAIQCKKYKSTVGLKAVQEVISSKAMNDCQIAAVMTNSTFTKSAKELALKNKVLLWDRNKLKEMIKNSQNY